MTRQFKELYDYRDFFFQLVYQQLHQRYSGSVLGFLWTLINPLLIYASFSIIFSMINHWDLKDYGIYFFSGYMFWNFFANSCLHGAESIVGNAGYVTRLYVPRMLFPFASLAVNLVDLGAGMLILFLPDGDPGDPVYPRTTGASRLHFDRDGICGRRRAVVRRLQCLSP